MKTNTPLGSKFFPCRVNPFSEGIWCIRKETESHKSCLSGKMCQKICQIQADLDGSVKRASGWWSGGRGFEPRSVRQHFFVIDHEIFSTDSLSLPLIQEGQLSVSGERLCRSTTVLSTSLGKTFFAWRFILNENILFRMTISSETICLFCFCVLFSNMYPKIKFMAKHWADLCNFYSKVIFWIFLLRK